MQKRNFNKAALQSHSRTNKPPKIRSTSAEHSPPEEHLWGTASASQKILKRLRL